MNATQAEAGAERPAAPPPDRPMTKAAAPLPGALPGSELPTTVYWAIVLLYLWMALAAWFAFGGERGVDLNLVVVSVLGTVFLGIPIIMYLAAAARVPVSRPQSKGFLSARFDTATGEMSGAQALLQLLLVPVALAVAATLIGAVHLLS